VQWDIGPARNDEIDAVVSVVADRIGEEDGVEARLVLEDPAFDRHDWLVARVDGEVAATAALLSGEMRYVTERLPAGNIEFVATRRDLQGRGAVRALMGALHDRAVQRGDGAIFIVGIPFFYRLFGYEYAIPDQSLFVVEPDTPVGGSGDLRVEVIGPGRVSEYQEVQRLLAGGADMAVEHSDQVARWLVESPNYMVALVMGPNGATGAYRRYEDDGHALLYDVAAAGPETLAAILTETRNHLPGRPITLVGRRATPLDAVLGKVGREIETMDGYYVKVPDLRRLLGLLTPVFEGRLANSSMAGWTGTLLISTYAASLTVEVEDGGFGDWGQGPGIQAPVSAGGSGVPPDRIATLLFGPHGAFRLEREYADVLLGRQRELMGILFPPVTADVLTWVKP
jgi:predicted N-acetyltransferase YhbS